MKFTRTTLSVLLIVLCALAVACAVVPDARAAGPAWTVDFTKFDLKQFPGGVEPTHFEIGLPGGRSLKGKYIYFLDGHASLYARDSALMVKFRTDKPAPSGYRLCMTHRGSALRMGDAPPCRQGNLAYLRIAMNGAAVVTDHCVYYTDDKYEEFDLGGAVKLGENAILFLLAPSTLTRYEIAKVSLAEK